MNRYHLLSMTKVVLVFMLMTFYLGSYAQSAEDKGLPIAKERKLRDSGWGDSTGEMSMILRNAQGDEVERKMRLKSLDIAGYEDKYLTIVRQPLDV